MVKGISRQVVVVRSLDTKLFEQAIFLIRDGALPRQGVTAAGNQEEYVVPEGCLFFLGDNRTNSQDARLWDNPYIPVDKVRSHVLVCISFLKENSWRGIRVVS